MLRRQLARNERKRKGVVIVIVATTLIIFAGMLAFAIDTGVIALARSELQRAADAAALAGAANLIDKGELSGSPNAGDERTAAALAVTKFTSANKSIGQTLSLVNSDVTVGYYDGEATPIVLSTTSSKPPNAVQVTVRRDSQANGEIGLFFGPIFNKQRQAVTAKATAYFETGISGFKINGSTSKFTCKLLPYTMKQSDFTNGILNGDDNFTHNSKLGSVSSGGDGIKEMKLFPLANGGGVTPGNFGTVDIGASNNSTADIARQIVYGPNESDFSNFPNNTLAFGADGTLTLNGDTGISAGVKDELASIIGQPRIIPLYTQVTGPGNNSQFTIVQFVGITIVDVKLTGSLSSKHIRIQPAFVVDGTTLGGGEDGATSRFIRKPLSLVE